MIVHFTLLLTYWWQGSAPWAALYPTVCGIALHGNRSKMVLLTLCPILFPEGHTSSGPPYVTWRVTSRDTATLGGIGSVFPATQILPNYSKILNIIIQIKGKKRKTCVFSLLSFTSLAGVGGGEIIVTFSCASPFPWYINIFTVPLLCHCPLGIY